MNAISALGAQTGLYHAHHGHHAKGADQASPIDLLGAPADADGGAPSIVKAEASPTTGAGGLAASLLSPSTLDILLGLQTVNGQVQGGATGAQLGLPQITKPEGMDPNQLLQDPTLQAMKELV